MFGRSQAEADAAGAPNPGGPLFSQGRDLSVFQPHASTMLFHPFVGSEKARRQWTQRMPSRLGTQSVDLST